MVRFANPAALWLLLLAIPILLLYLLKRKRREQVVPSLLLWKQALEDLRAQTPFQKLKSSLLLFLQLLILVLITAILSDPYLPGSISSSRWILVLDASASMKATDEQPDRFTGAKERLLGELQRVRPIDEVMLICFSASASVVQSFSRNHAAVREKLQSLKAEDVAGNWQQVHLILTPLSKEAPVPRIVIASDFCGFPPEIQSIAFDAIPVGNRSENAGITRAALEPMPEDPGRQILFYQIKNFSRNDKVLGVELYVDNQLLDAFDISLPAGQAMDRSAEMRISQPVRIRIQLKPEDDLIEDNDFVILARPAEPYQVQNEIQNPFLLRALQALPSIKVSSSGEAVISPIQGPKPGIYFLSAGKDSPSGSVVQWNDSHPALRFVEAGFWRLAHHTVLSPPPGSVVLLETADGPTAYAQEQQEIRKIVLGFSLEDSNLPLYAGFPVFLQNSLEWIRAGSVDTLPILTGSNYRHEGPIREGMIEGYVNFADVKESAIQPQKPSVRGSMVRRTEESRRDMATWFLLLLAVTLILEWWVFHRRIQSEA